MGFVFLTPQLSRKLATVLMPISLCSNIVCYFLISNARNGVAHDLNPSVLPSWFPVGKTQIRGYFRELSRRLENYVRAGRETHAGDDGETENATEEIGAEAAETLGATARATKSGGCEGNETDENRTKQFTDSVQEEVGKLQRIMYDFPKTPGGVPEAFLDDRTRENAATLEKDGVEEDHDRNRSNRTKDSVVITIDG